MSITLLNKEIRKTTTKKPVSGLLLLFCIFKFSAVFGQNPNFSVSTLANLGLVYQSEKDFETARVIPKAFRLNFGRNSPRMMVSARVISNMNHAFSILPNNMYSITLNATNATVNSSYKREFQLDFTDQNILMHSSTGRGNYNSTTYYDYDMKVAAIGYDSEPGQYFYSILFTLTEQ